MRRVTSFVVLCSTIGHLIRPSTGLPSYQRPAPSPILDLSDSALIRKSADPHLPDQVHLALAGPGSLAISWVTWPDEDEELRARVASAPTPSAHLSKKKHKKDRCKHLRDYPLQPTALFGLRSKDLKLNATGSYSCYSSEVFSSGALHTVLIGREEPLLPGEKYYYKVGDPQLGWSEEQTFIMPAAAGPDNVPYKLGLIGDLGQTEDSAKTLKHLNKLDVATVLDVGDLSYADSYQPRWDSWGRLLEYHTSKIPWMHIEGNHEEEDLDGNTGFVAYEERLYFPAEESGSNSPFYYSYETGPVHVIMLGCYVEYLKHSEQAAWLLRDLASVDRGRTPWVVVGMHAPWYNSFTAHQGEVDDMRDDLEPYLLEHGVDIVFAGHVHAFERSSGGVFQGKRTKCAPTYITIGDGGNREGLSTDTLKQPDWSEVRESSYGMGMLTFENSTHALWQWHRNKDHVSEVADEYWLQRFSECTAKAVQGAEAAHSNQVVIPS